VQVITTSILLDYISVLPPIYLINFSLETFLVFCLSQTARKNKRMMPTYFFTLVILMLSSFALFYFDTHIAMLLQVMVIILWFVVIRGGLP
jgi:hypothetical protein